MFLFVSNSKAIIINAPMFNQKERGRDLISFSQVGSWGLVCLTTGRRGEYFIKVELSLTGS